MKTRNRYYKKSPHKKTKKKRKLVRKRRSIMRRRRKHLQMKGGSMSYVGLGNRGFAAGFVAGYNSCVPGQHYQGYTHPI